ncbi:hypothetical protein V5H98_14285 [Georgenia sp. M64]|uniref:hypothetical protein n=1 Tax=Georgenia sp. M64 TaxID=3120520 RepID=UPI0030E1EBA8
MLARVAVTLDPGDLVRPAAFMGKLIYAANTSLDGYLEAEAGSFDWSVPEEEVHTFWNEHERHIGTSLAQLIERLISRIGHRAKTRQRLHVEPVAHERQDVVLIPSVLELLSEILIRHT